LLSHSQKVTQVAEAGEAEAEAAEQDKNRSEATSSWERRAALYN